MTTLTLAPEDRSRAQTLTDPEAIRAALAEVGVLYARWEASEPLAADASPDDVLRAYAAPIAALDARHGFRSVDVVRMHPEHPSREAARARFLAEHTHDDFEMRFFVEGSGSFYLHIGDTVYTVRCSAGDLLSVPPATRHWFDMGERPFFTAIRLFTTPGGWEACFTGSDIATRFPGHDP